MQRTRIAEPAKRTHAPWRWLPLAILAGILIGTAASGGLWSLPATHFLYQGSATPTQTTVVPTPLAASAITDAPTLNPIQQENSLRGSAAWRIPNGRAATTQIQGYASAESAAPGQTLTFYVSTQRPRDPYTVDVYRLGWYASAGGRLLSSFRETGQAQGYYDATTLSLINCSTCRFDPATRMLDAGWRPSFQVTIADDWVTGLYIAKLTTAENMQAYIHFTVTGDPHAAYIATMPDTSTEAYNDWGGYSLYHGPDQRLETRAFKVSLNRPAPGWRYGYGAGLSQVIDAIRWMERNGYDVSYISTVDLHEHPDVLLTHHAYLSLGHDEYWSSAMRDGVERARDSGIGLAFLGANAAYWNIRFEPDSKGIADRVIVCYKDAHLDPLYGKDNAHVTVEWRQPPLNRPENELIGIMYADYTIPPKGWTWSIPPNVSSPLLAKTGLHPGASYGCNVVGYEWDHIFNNGETPPGLHVLGDSYTDGLDYGSSDSQTTYYISRSGAFVFASGSIYWSYALDNLHIWDVPNIYPDQWCLLTNASAAVPGIERLMTNVMAQLVINHRPLHRIWRPTV